MIITLLKRFLPDCRFIKICPAIVVTTFILLVLISFIAVPKLKREFTEHGKSEAEPNKKQYIRKINYLCEPTEYIRRIREIKGTVHINPARQIVEELLQLVTLPANVCPTKTETDRVAFVIVHSARNHSKERELIRKTWGSVRQYKNWKVTTVFSIGQPEYCVNPTDNENSTRALEEYKTEEIVFEENKLHGDILIGVFADTYRNLTYKHLMSYKYVLEYCPQADFIIKTDDDMFVDLFKILEMRTEELETTVKPADIYCHPFHDNPTRCQNCPNGKHFSSREEWPEDTYPKYCIGNDFGISTSWLDRIYSVRNKGGFFWVDDVFILGKLRKIAEDMYNQTIVEKNIIENVTFLEKPNGDYDKINCEDKNLWFGLFVFMKREWNEFTANMECFWKKSVDRVKTRGVNFIID